jgi:hypothetical protein
VSRLHGKEAEKFLSNTWNQHAIIHGFRLFLAFSTWRKFPQVSSALKSTNLNSLVNAYTPIKNIVPFLNILLVSLKDDINERIKFPYHQCGIGHRMMKLCEEEMRLIEVLDKEKKNFEEIDSTGKSILKECGYCRKEVNELKLCSRCKQIYYCNKDCQKSDYSSHKNACKKR